MLGALKVVQEELCPLFMMWYTQDDIKEPDNNECCFCRWTYAEEVESVALVPMWAVAP